MDNQLHQIRVTDIVPSRWQPRERFDEEALLELAKHIKDHDLMYPVILFVNEDGEHELVAGERRTRAVVALGLTQARPWVVEHGNGLRKAVAHVAEHGWAVLASDLKQALADTTVAARVEHLSCTDSTGPDGSDHRRLHELAVADNIQRENLSPLEEARALHDLMREYGLSQRDVAAQIGWSQSKVQERLSLLNLAQEAREAVTARAVSISHARHIARCPIEVQPAVTQYVEALVDRDGDQAATVRQVASLTQQVRKFLNPQRWLPPDGEVIEPQRRNMLRLVHHVVSAADLAEHGEGILDLHTFQSNWTKTNLLGKKPTSLGRGDLGRIVEALTGVKRSLDGAWQDVAQAQGWTCDHCQFRDRQPPARHEDFRLPCKRWLPQHAHRGQGEAPLPEVTTCLDSFIGPDDPFLIPAGWETAGWGRKLIPDDLIEEPFDHFVDYEAWKRLVEEATVARAEQQQQAEQERQTKHIVELNVYWQEQQTGLFADVKHFQAHRCEKCIHYRPELLERDLPPCEFAADPLTCRYSNRPEAPDFGVLVRQNGLMVPRCVHFRLADLEIARMAGFRLPDREVVMGWFHAAALSASGSGPRVIARAGPLAWLPYPRPKREDVHDLDSLLRYVKKAWDDLGDEAVATLLATANLESRARGRYRGKFELLDPTELAFEQWASVSWETVIDGEKPGRYSYYPKGWPTPWVKR